MNQIFCSICKYSEVVQIGTSFITVPTLNIMLIVWLHHIVEFQEINDIDAGSLGTGNNKMYISVFKHLEIWVFRLKTEELNPLKCLHYS